MKVLFICTHNRCRSILAEAIARHTAGGWIEAASAGSQPAGEVHPLSLHYLKERGVPTEGLRSKSWSELNDFEPDLVITVCDSAAQEACPVWLGRSLKVHWGLPDPSRLNAPADRVGGAFRAVMDALEARIAALAEVDLDPEDRDSNINRLEQIAEDNPCRFSNAT
ncbi:arsenate reductase ArsC [Gilvimarinus sp. F26214L]|uniref:arsenate reductase ArsC n=1 Tax=Gilvimarinus sp. DZF01 TaxID=3461371 RepID=UPI0040456729